MCTNRCFPLIFYWFLLDSRPLDVMTLETITNDISHDVWLCFTSCDFIISSFVFRGSQCHRSVQHDVMLTSYDVPPSPSTHRSVYISSSGWTPIGVFHWFSIGFWLRGLVELFKVGSVLEKLLWKLTKVERFKLDPKLRKLLCKVKFNFGKLFYKVGCNL